MGYPVVKVVDPSPPAPSPEARLWQAVTHDCVWTLMNPAKAYRKIRSNSSPDDDMVEAFRERECAYVRSELFEQHCAWAQLDPFAIRAALRQVGLL